MAKYLDSTGVKHYTEKIKDGTIIAGKTKEVVVGGKVPASTIDGVLSLDNIPQGAKERVVVVANQAARYALTTDKIQLGDTVKENDTGLLYVVVDESNLGNANGYMEYLSGQTKEQLGYNASTAATTVSYDQSTQKLSVAETDGFGNGSQSGSVTLPNVDSTYSGLMIPADKIKLDKITLNSSNAISSNVEWGSVINKPSITLPSGSLNLGASSLSINQQNIIPDKSVDASAGMSGLLNSIKNDTSGTRLYLGTVASEVAGMPIPTNLFICMRTWTVSSGTNADILQIAKDSIYLQSTRDEGSTWTATELYTNDSALTTSEIDTAIAAAN